MAPDRNYPPVTPNNYRVSLPSNTEFEFVSAHTIFPYRKAGIIEREVNTFIMTVYENENPNPIFRNTYTINATDTWPGDTHVGEDIGYKLVLKNGVTYKVTYTYRWIRDNANQFTNTVSYYMLAVENKLPLKSFSVTDVINRVLDLAEPIRGIEKPKFRLNAEQAERFDKITAPQFSMTKQTLRECLQEIGSFIHGEPRLTPKKVTDTIYKLLGNEDFERGRATISAEDLNNKYPSNMRKSTLINNVRYRVISGIPDGVPSLTILDANGDRLTTANGMFDVYDGGTETAPYWIYEVSYDMWASTEKSGVYVLPYIKKTVSQLIDSYASYLDSNAENLVNQLDKYSGVIIEPYKGGAKTVRTDVSYVRIEENNIITLRRLLRSRSTRL